MKLSCCDQSDRGWSMMKTKLDNEVTDRIDLVYVETETKLLGPIWSGVVSCEDHIG